MSSDAPSEHPPTDPPAKPPLGPLPRLRVHHILLWTAVTAGWLTIGRLYFDTFRESAGVRLSMVHSSLLGAAIVYGAATTVVGLGIYWRAKGLSFFTQPGHWLACWITLSILWTIAANLLAYMQRQAVVETGGWLPWLLFHPWIGLVVVGTGLVSLAIWAADTRAWRMLFVGWAIFNCLPRLIGAVGWGRWLASVQIPWWLVTNRFVPLALLAIAGMNDYRNRRTVHRHWSHWAGVLIGVALMSFELGMLVWIWLVPPQP